MFNLVLHGHKLTQSTPLKKTAKILLTGSSADIHGSLANYLSRYGFQVTTAKNRKQMHAALLGCHYDLIVLDVMLSDEDGLSLCRFVCEHYAIPVILLSDKGETSDCVAGLEIGADDYLVKPFDSRELVARIRSVIRRNQASALTSRQSSNCYCFSNWWMDIEKREIYNQQNGQPLELGGAEFRLLQVLLENPNTVLSRDRLLDLTSHPQESGVFDRSIDTLISRVRRKLGDNARKPRLLRTVWGSGYILTTEVLRLPRI